MIEQQQQQDLTGFGNLSGLTTEDAALIFVHILKAGGTTLHHLLETQFAPEESFATCSTQRFPGNTLNDFEALSKEQLVDVRLLNGHMGFGLHRHLPRPAVYITMLREPIERVLSHYSFDRTLPGSPVYAHLQSGEMDLKGYVQHYADAAEMDNLQTRMIAGNWHKRGFGPCTPKMLEQAKHNLRERFVVVGLTEQFDASYLLLARTFGWRPMCYRRRNKTRKRVYRDEVTAGEIDTIRQHNEYDLQLYAYARQLFNEQIRQQGIAFQLELARFRLQNRLYNQYWRARTYSLRANLRKAGIHRILGKEGNTTIDSVTERGDGRQFSGQTASGQKEKSVIIGE